MFFWFKIDTGVVDFNSIISGDLGATEVRISISDFDIARIKGKNVHIENSPRIYCRSPIKTCHFFVALGLNFILHLKTFKNIEMC